MGIVVRGVGAEEWRALREVRLAALLDAPYAFYSSYEQAAARHESEWRAWPRNGIAFLARLGGESVGMVGAAPAPADPTRGDLIAMWVAPAARGTGVADALVGAAVAWGRDQGWTFIDLEVAPGNDPAVRLYARNGFLPTGESTHIAAGLAMRHSY
jgi:ribosomal protein S18 acetylase RimI-like enzyme